MVYSVVMNTRTAHEVAIREALATLAAHYSIPTPNPTILWNLKGKSVLGQARGTSVIRLHPLAADLLGEDKYRQTALHEACHTITLARMSHAGLYVHEGRWSAHGAEWRNAMRLLGQRPDRCATLPAGVVLPAARKVERFTVACACRTHQITKVRLNKGLARYKCAKCGSALRLV